MQLRAGVLGSALVVVLCAVATGCAPAPPTGDCWPGVLTVAPAIARPGEEVSVSSRPVACSIRFTEDRWYRLELQYPRWDVTAEARVRVAPDGSFETTMRVPAGAPPGRPSIVVTDGFTTRCGPGASCIGVSGEVQVARPAFVPPDLRALQARLDAGPTQEGRLTDLGTDRVCLTLDRPWTSNLDITLPSGWRQSGEDVVNAAGAVVARVGDFVRVGIESTRAHSRIPGCKRDRTVVTARDLRRITHPPSTPPGGRLIVGTETLLRDDLGRTITSTGTLVGERHGDYLCVSIRTSSGRAQHIALPPGTTARPDGHLFDGSDTGIAQLGDRVFVNAAPRPVSTPAGCDGNADALAVSSVDRR